MIRKHTSVLQRIGKALHHQHDDYLKGPLPQRWIDLILYLDEKEQQQSKAREPEDKSPPAAACSSNIGLSGRAR